MKSARRTPLAALLALGASLATLQPAQAAGPLYLWEGSNPPRPYAWKTGAGPIPVYTDGGGAFTWFDVAETVPFITIARANEITQFAFNQWNNVPTATFEAAIAGTIAEQTGIADVTPANASQIYGAVNGYGFWVVYDTDGYILESIFGVPRSSVLGIAFPEWADEATGEIIEATALMNGWNVSVNDVGGNRVAGVFTHEFGHALNMSHTQVNGQMAYFGYTYAPKYPGPRGCVAPLYRTAYPASSGLARVPANRIETMYPFINHLSIEGQEQSTVDMPDDIAAISNLYPTASYLSSTGSISGTLYLKDGKTPYSGINVIARNVANPIGDAVSAMTGDQTQGLLGPDGRFTIHGLTPGQQYLLYIEEIWAGGFPTTPARLVSQSEYWNAAEGSDPAVDVNCSSTAIPATAGVTQSADIVFNGYAQGIQYRPIVSAHLTDLAKSGRSSAGLSGNTSFLWDESKGFIVLPPEFTATNGQMTRNGQSLLVAHDPDGNGIQEATLWSEAGVEHLGDLNRDTCGSSAVNGVNSSYGWAVDDAGRTAVGLAYVDKDGNGTCTSSNKGELAPFIWTKKKGMRELDTTGKSSNTWVRAQAISGDGRVVLGQNGGSRAVAWVNEGPMVNLYNLFKARDGYAVSYNGSRVALDTTFLPGNKPTVVLWNPFTGGHSEIGGLTWCVDLPYVHPTLGNLCTHPSYGAAWVQANLGSIPVLPADMNDDGTVIVGRAGNIQTGFLGAMWIQDLGWLNLRDFFRRQGVAEAFDFPIDNPISISASGQQMVGGLAGVTAAWHVEMSQVFVCKDGVSVQTGFPNGLRNEIAGGALLGRCEFIP